MTTQLTTTTQSSTSLEVFSNEKNFESAQRMAKALCSSDLVPASYKNNLSNCLLALEMANRIGASPLMVMQNLNIIKGKPSFGSSFIIATINSSGRFGVLRFRFRELGMLQWNNQQIQNVECVAYATDKETNEVIEGSPVTIEMAIREGWYNKPDSQGRETSKWPSMPRQMLMYRSASFFGKTYCPEVLMGMQTSEELIDMGLEEQAVVVVDSNPIAQLNGTVIKNSSQQKSAKKQPSSVEPFNPNTTSFASENSHLASPAPVDAVPSSVHFDHVQQAQFAPNNQPNVNRGNYGEDVL